MACVASSSNSTKPVCWAHCILQPLIAYVLQSLAAMQLNSSPSIAHTSHIFGKAAGSCILHVRLVQFASVGGESP